MVQVSWNSQNIVNAVHSTEEIMNGADWAGGILNNGYSWVLHPTAGDWRPGLGSPGHKKQGKVSVHTESEQTHTDTASCKLYNALCAGHLTCASYNQSRPMRGHNWLITSAQIQEMCTEKFHVGEQLQTRRTKMPEREQDVYFCKCRVSAQCFAVFNSASQQQKKFHCCSQSNATPVLY